MSADEDTELRDLVAQTLETNGTLGKLRAQLRASVFLALEDQDNGQSKTPFLNKDLRGFLSTREGQLTASLIQEFLEYFKLDFTLAVFKPEIGLNDAENRTALIDELNLKQNSPINAPLLTCLLKNGGQSAVNGTIPAGSGDHIHVSADLSDKQVDEARKKFEYYDKDSSGAIEKNELRKLFIDMFPDFHRNMLERYVNDEFSAVDKDFSSSIDFNEFLGMYKRLFLLCRAVVASHVTDVVPPTHQTHKANHQNSNTQLTKPTAYATKTAEPSNGPVVSDTSTGADRFTSDIEVDPFFDNIPATTSNFSTLSNELEKSKENQAEAKENGDKAKSSSSGMTSLDGLPSLTSGRGSESLMGARPGGTIKSPIYDQNDSDFDKNLREIDKRMKDFGVDSQNEDFEYEDDFSPEHSLSQKNSKPASKPENGSIAEEIEDEEIDEDISIEADDLLNSEKSGFDDLTTDHSVSQADGGFDYIEEPVLP